MKNKIITKTLFILTMLLSLTSVAMANVVLPASATAHPVNVSYLQTASSVTLQLENRKKGTYLLTLHVVNPYTTYFSDRPNRVIGKITNKTFIERWDEGENSFRQDAPNAMLNGLVQHNNQLRSVNIAMVLSDPIYNAAKGTITYHVTVLDKVLHSVTSLRYGVLFIDSGACITCIG